MQGVVRSVLGSRTDELDRCKHWTNLAGMMVRATLASPGIINATATPSIMTWIRPSRYLPSQGESF